jgi:hypothetical protein
METLRALQQLLFREILRAERKIRELKAELRGRAKSGGKTFAKRSSFLKNRIEGLRQCVYVWRCFGDAIAFTYLDKHALKQCFYNIQNVKARQAAGFLSDKVGVASEIALLESVLAENVPALLTDLTNTIRYGDICIMFGPDPQLVEVKTSKALDRRGRKQKQNLEKLSNFFETDRAVDFRGFPEVHRHALESPVRSYVAEMNTCIVEGSNNGHAVAEPEPGLYYVVMATKTVNIDEVFKKLKLKGPWVFDLNSYKNARAWAPYLPFVLTIENKDHLWAFIRGDLYILVLAELDDLSKIAEKYEFEISIDRENENYPLRLQRRGSDDYINIASHVVARIGLELVSPSWIAQSTIEILNRRAQEVAVNVPPP